MTRTAIFLLVSFACTTANADVYKCIENGKQVFSDVPCLSGAEKVNVKPAAGAATEDRSWANNAILRGAIRVGMTDKEVVRSWGPPSKINKSISGSGSREQWVYERGNYQSQYVYLENGVVTAASD